MRVFLFLCIIFEIPLAIVSPNLNLRTMDLTFSTPLKGNLVLCSDYRDAALHRSPGLYKFVWVGVDAFGSKSTIFPWSSGLGCCCP